MEKREKVILYIIQRNEKEQAPRKRRYGGGKRNSVVIGARIAQVSPGMTPNVKHEMNKIVGPKKFC